MYFEGKTNIRSLCAAANSISSFTIRGRDLRVGSNTINLRITVNGVTRTTSIPVQKTQGIYLTHMHTHIHTHTHTHTHTCTHIHSLTGDTDYKIILKMKIRICYILMNTFSFQCSILTVKCPLILMAMWS